MMLRIGIIGANGSGKSTCCQYLHSQGFVVVSLSDVVRRAVEKIGLEPTRAVLTEEANRLKKAHGLCYFARECMAYVTTYHANQSVVFDSVRHPQEVAFLKENGVMFWGVTASSHSRYERVFARKKQTDFVSKALFLEQDKQEREGHHAGQHIDACLSQCTVHIDNNGTKDAFVAQLEKAYQDACNIPS